MTPEEAPLVLVIEDEAPIRQFLRAALASHGYAVAEAATGGDGLRLAAEDKPALVILDLGLPDIDGLEVTRRLREWSSVPLIVLSARGREEDKVAALDAGADDYLTKPFGVKELVARLRVAQRHAVQTPGATDTVLEVGDLRLDFSTRRVFLRGAEVRLTPLEYRLLATLGRTPGRVMTHRHLLAEVWGPGYEDEAHYVRLFMSQLRRKIEDDPARPRYLRTEPGVGYRFLPD
jgi:two-component system KDP operon response regulator KdpE